MEYPLQTRLYVGLMKFNVMSQGAFAGYTHSLGLKLSHLHLISLSVVPRGSKCKQSISCAAILPYTAKEF